MAKKNVTTNATANYGYTTIKSGNQTIVVWNDLAKMMMGNGLSPMGCRVLKEKGGKMKK